MQGCHWWWIMFVCSHLLHCIQKFGNSGLVLSNLVQENQVKVALTPFDGAHTI